MYGIYDARIHNVIGKRCKIQVDGIRRPPPLLLLLLSLLLFISFHIQNMCVCIINSMYTAYIHRQIQMQQNGFGRGTLTATRKAHTKYVFLYSVGFEYDLVSNRTIAVAVISHTHIYRIREHFYPFSDLFSFGISEYVDTQRKQTKNLAYIRNPFAQGRNRTLQKYYRHTNE